MFAIIGLGVIAVLTVIVMKIPIREKYYKTRKVLRITGLIVVGFVLILGIDGIEKARATGATGTSELTANIEVINSLETTETSKMEPQKDYLAFDTFGAYFIGLKGIAFKIDDDGNNVIVLTMDYSHDKKWSKKTYGWNINTKVSQDGVVCNSNSQWKSDNHYDEIKGGVVLEVVEAFTLRDNSPIEIEITPLFNLASGELIYTITDGIPLTVACVTKEPATIIVSRVTATPDQSGSIQSSYSYNAQSGEWEQVYHTIEPEPTTTVSTTEEGLEWLSASGHLYTGVELYVGIGDSKQYYGFVAEIDTKNELVRVFVDLAEGYMWFPRTSITRTSFYIRSDDSMLPWNR